MATAFFTHPVIAALVDLSTASGKEVKKINKK